MTHEEIKAAIERLRAVQPQYGAYEILKAFNVNVEKCFKDVLIELLEQADPDAHMLLPVDANGEPIHVGDEMRWRDGETFEVNAISSTTLYYYDETSGRMEWAQAADKYHYHKPTVESVLTEYAKKLLAWHNDSDPSDSADDELALVVKYAAKLREVMADDDAR